MQINPNKIKEARGEMTLDQLVLAMSNLAGRIIPRQAVNNWEMGNNKPSAEYLLLLSKATGKPMEFFFEADVNKSLTHLRAKANRKRVTA